MTYKAKTITGAQARVRTLERRIKHMMSLIDKLAKERLALAKLAAEEPMFFNPIEAREAERLRDRLIGKETR